ncbi:MAG: HypC/HybG/HupF family hydrogenase formation chaperone [Thermovirgaceae bacterium]|jgi:hydrogenase expression/formation protein HypC|nr:HypC/HybG/HupF family hydrogenase formation chaperone [Synergistales bacterium]MDI9392951.1 HypC/HybG/HupF family hydrogenase formation chaperone [Synergistota bacterium]MDY0178652.1 HypC/HybG/HupF family hydrogenase formation chaperone [Synergistaceae bacterium]HRW87352.1 HypC/HybG/HupF family hydrogenase formation chaperone [Thermovirgaceae bacterium]MDD3133797.1 HypC/HybG/HupF family hydrogenase formation chaperone [Synergistales bacterium]
MCLAVPHRIIALRATNRALALAGAVETEIRTDLVPGLGEGDLVLVHAGFAIERLLPEEGEELERLWEEVRELAGPQTR